MLKAPPPADYHPLLTSGIFSALQRAARANVKMLILRIPPINCISIFVTESARLVLLHRASHHLPVSQRVWALMCHVFVTDCFLFKFSFFSLSLSECFLLFPRAEQHRCKRRKKVLTATHIPEKSWSKPSCTSSSLLNN